MWLHELKQAVNPSNLPCGFTVVGITLAPPSAENNVGEDHTVTATLSDLLGNPQVVILVDFFVESGPNAGASGTCSNNADCTSDANGLVSFTYTGLGGVGTDEIKACSTDQGGHYLCSQLVTKDWLNNPPVADANGPYSVQEDMTITLDGTATYAWVANYVDNSVSSYRINGDGTLTALGTVATATAPESVIILTDQSSGGVLTNKYAYVTAAGGTVWRHTIPSTGALQTGTDAEVVAGTSAPSLLLGKLEK